MKVWQMVAGGIAALAVLGAGAGSSATHGSSNPVDKVIPPDVRLTAEAAGGYALGKGGAARLSQPKPQTAAPAPAPTTSTTTPGPLLHPWAATPTTVPQPAAPLGDPDGSSGWHFTAPNPKNLVDNLGAIGRLFGGGHSATPVPAPAPIPPIVAVP